MLISGCVAYWKPSNLNNISVIFGIGCGLWFNCLFRFLMSVRKRTQIDLVFVVRRIGLPVLNHSLFQWLLVGLNVQPPFWTFIHVYLVMDMVASILYLHSLLIRSLLDMFSRCQLFYRTTETILVLILEGHCTVFLSDFVIEFP